jgi:endonuclease YncB( thermonuclease family)
MLRIEGRIDVDQFWPAGQSDADTTKIVVHVNRSSFFFAADGQDFRPTTVFFGARSRGTGTKQVVSDDGKITVRLQGVDAPELHFRAAALKKSPDVSDTERAAYNTLNRPKRRQYWGETATVALARMLRRIDATALDCVFVSAVDAPGDVVDTYGRFVGNIRVGADFARDLNLWLAEEGWVFPSFYSSMSADEIEALIAACKKGKRKRRVWPAYSDDTASFDPDLVYRGEGVPIDAAADRGPILMPKVYRRQVAYRMERGARVFRGSFTAFLKSRPDDCYGTKDFLDQGHAAATIMKLHDFMDGDRIALKPEDVVFREKPSRLVDTNGRTITRF